MAGVEDQQNEDWVSTSMVQFCDQETVHLIKCSFETKCIPILKCECNFFAFFSESG